MKIDLLDIDRFIEANGIKQVVYPKIYSGSKTFHSGGIFSDEIFGISKVDRKESFGYIDLGRPYLHPHIYHNILKRMFNKVDYMISGQRKYLIQDGIVVEDAEHGWTGIQNLYKHWDEIEWNKSGSSNERSLNFLSNIPKNKIFIQKQIVCPPLYRDISMAGSVDRSDHVPEINSHYMKLMNLVEMASQGGGMLFKSYITDMSIQQTLVTIFKHFKDAISEKTGLIRKYLLGKSVDYGARTVISAFSYNNETIEENMVDIDHTALPLAQCCSTFRPFIESWIRIFFTREIINNPNLVSFYDADKNKDIVAMIKDPELQFSDRAIEKLIDDYMLNPDNRFKIIYVNTIIETKQKDTPVKASIILKGKKILLNNVEEVLNRPMTITDIIYLACVEVCEKRHCLVTRYPVGTDKGMFMNKIVVQSTRQHQKIIFNGKEYPYYPYIDFNVPREKIGVQFVDTAVFSNSLLDGLGGDFDGDQVSVRGIWSDEANHEVEEIMNRKMTALNVTGVNSRTVSKEIFNSYYALTKIEKSPIKSVSQKDSEDYLNTTPDGFTRSKLIDMFAITTDNSGSKNNTVRTKPKYNTWDKFMIPSNYFYEDQAALDTTIGRFIFNKYILEGSGIIQQTKIINQILGKSGIGDIDKLIGQLYLEDHITRQQFNAYINRRDNLGFWLNGMLAHTISQRMLKPLKEIEQLKKELYKKHAKEIEEGDINVMTDISNQLVTRAEELLKDDPGMDLYLSGDLDFGNNYKNNSILKGPVMNDIEDKFDFVGSSFMNGIEIQDIPAHANSILAGQFPTSIATKESGYMGKKLLALLQMAEVDEPGTDCGTKKLIPITVTKKNKSDLVYTYFEVAGQLQLLTHENIDSFVGKTILSRSPMSCITPKICSKCAGELFYKLEIQQAGLFATQISHSALNLALKSKHNSLINLHSLDPDNIIDDL